MFLLSFAHEHTRNFFPLDDEGVVKPQTNIPDPNTDKESCGGQTVIKKITEVSSFPFFNGNGSFAAFHQDGTAVDYPIFPFETRLYANMDAVPAWDDEEYPDQLDHITQIQPDDEVPFYEVWANSDPDEEFFHIADIYITSDVVRSLFGDQRLHFRHEAWRKDTVTLVEQGESDRATTWRKWAKNKQGGALGDDDKWNDAEVAAYPDGYTTEEVITYGAWGVLEGQEGTQCPFAWML